MLVLTRKTQQQIQIGDKITITIVRVTGQSVRVGIQAPEEVRVIRGELAGASKPAKKPQDGNSAPAHGSDAPAAHSGPLSSRCRNRLVLAPQQDVTASQHGLDEAHPAPAPCMTDRRRVPGASVTPLIRRPQRLGPACLSAMAGRLR
jgi:carbon storage regulator CsrA